MRRSGYRSSGPIRASLYGGADYHMKANDIVVAFGMIETQEAIDNLDEILSVKGLDAIYVGPQRPVDLARPSTRAATSPTSG